MACSVCFEDYGAPGSPTSCLALGPCAHCLCLGCATRTCATLMTEYALAGGVCAKGYVAPHLARSTLPGLLCPLCATGAAERQAFSAAHWRSVAAMRARAQRGVSWRVAVDPREPWSAAFYDRDGGLIFRLASPGGADDAPCTTRLALAAPQDLDITQAETGFHVYSVGGGGAAGAALAAFAAPRAPAPRRVSFSGAATLGTVPRPPTLLPGWLSPAALAALTAFATTPAAAALGIQPLHPTAVQGAEQALLLLSLFLASLARDHSNAPYGGALVGSLSSRSASSSSSSGGGSTPGGSGGAPTSPTLAAPLLCPHEGCGAVLSVDLPRHPDPDTRGVHLTCTQCHGGLCGSCGLPWSAPGATAVPTSHAGSSCSAHAALFARLSLGDVSGEEGLTEAARSAVKRCPVPACGALIFRYRGCVRRAAPQLRRPARRAAAALTLFPPPPCPHSRPTPAQPRLPQCDLLKVPHCPVLCVPGHPLRALPALAHWLPRRVRRNLRLRTLPRLRERTLVRPLRRQPCGHGLHQLQAGAARRDGGRAQPAPGAPGAGAERAQVQVPAVAWAAALPR